MGAITVSERLGSLPGNGPLLASILLVAMASAPAAARYTPIPPRNR